MSGNFSRIQTTFRKTFTRPNSVVAKWFPGHMQKGYAQIQAKLKSVDCILEIHDARIPFTGRNLYFKDLIKLRPHILLLSKSDLVDLSPERKMFLSEKFKEEGVDTVFWANLKQKGNFLQKNVLPSVKDIIESRPRYQREGLDEYNILVIGIPNVGKSTCINELRSSALLKHSKATAVGSRAGVTRSVLTRIRISLNPSIYIIDTPGILTPRIKGLETGMRLGACACLPDHLVGEVNIVDYILFWLNSRACFEYVDYFGLDQPTDNVLELLYKIALQHTKVFRIKNVATNQFEYRPDNAAAAVLFLSAFRDSKLGKHILDDNFEPE